MASAPGRAVTDLLDSRHHYLSLPLPLRASAIRTEGEEAIKKLPSAELVRLHSHYRPLRLLEQVVSLTEGGTPFGGDVRLIRKKKNISLTNAFTRVCCGACLSSESTKYSFFFQIQGWFIDHN